VAYNYHIGKYDVTVGQYTAFLNAVAATDKYGLYIPQMATDPEIAGIAQHCIAGKLQLQRDRLAQSSGGVCQLGRRGPGSPTG